MRTRPGSTVTRLPRRLRSCATRSRDSAQVRADNSPRARFDATLGAEPYGQFAESWSARNQHAPILMRRGQHLFVARRSDDIACSFTTVEADLTAGARQLYRRRTRRQASASSLACKHRLVSEVVSCKRLRRVNIARWSTEGGRERIWSMLSPAAKTPEDVLHREPCAADHRFTHHDLRVALYPWMVRSSALTSYSARFGLGVFHSLGNDRLAHHDLWIALDAGLGHLCASDVHGNARSYHEPRPVAASLSTPRNPVAST